MSLARAATARVALSASAAWLLLAGCSALSSQSDDPQEPVDSAPDPGVTAPVATGGASGATAGAVGASEPATGGAASPPSAPPLDPATPTPTVTPVDAGLVSNAPDAAAPFQGAAVFTVTTKQAADSRYAPRNVVAIWIEDASGAAVKVLAELAGVMRTRLELYNQRVMPPAFFQSVTERDPDTITMATQRTYGTTTVRWDLTDTKGQPVPDGLYTIFVECADGRDPPGVASVAFEKGPEAVALDVAESDQFGPISLQYTPPDP